MKAARGLEIIRTCLYGVNILTVEADNKKRKQSKGVVSECNAARRDGKEGEVRGCGTHGVHGAVAQGPKPGNSYSAITLLKFLIPSLTWYFVSDIWWAHGVCLGLSMTPKSHGVSPGLAHLFCGGDPFLFVVIRLGSAPAHGLGGP